MKTGSPVGARGTPRAGRGARAAVAALALVFVLGCGSEAGGGSGSAPGSDDADVAAGRTLSGGASGLEELGAAVVSALAARDTVRLERLRLDRQEYVHLVWPELPASNPEADVSVELVWDGIVSRNAPAVRSLLGRWGGRDLTFRSVRCEGPVHELGPMVVREGCAVRFLAGDEPGVKELWLDEVLAWEGRRHKLFRYYASR